MRTPLLTLALAACGGPTATPTPFDAMPAAERRGLPGLRCDALVARTEGNVPHIYARDREDLARVLGFVMARDRFFEMDLARRLGLGTVAEILGADALETDMESRAVGMTHVAEQVLANLTPEQAGIFDAFAQGVNGYILAVQRGELDPPSELAIASGLLGADSPVELMAPFDRRSVAGVAATLVYELGFETGDVGRAASAETLTTLFEGAPLQELRQAGVYADVWDRVDPVYPVSSAPGWGTAEGAAGPPGPRAARRPHPLGAPPALLARLGARLDRLQRRLGHDWEHGFGSNAWAVTAAASADGRAHLAGDGHLPLSVPSLFWQVGLDTALLGGGDTRQLGLAIPGLPLLAVGTNGQVAWSQTQFAGDITDWYREEVQLDALGVPTCAVFQGVCEPLQAVTETFVIADVPALGSEGRTETWTRWVTADGRWIAEVEGVRADPDDPPEGRTVLNFGGDFIAAEDTDGDGVIEAVSFDYTGLDDNNLLLALDRMGHSADVWALREATRGLVAYSQNIVAADSAGDVLYTGYQAVPCRDNLPRDASGWAPGADPSLLLDGTTYGGFVVPVRDGVVDEAAGCLVPFEEWPQAVSPAEGFVLSANNDPGNITTDNDLLNDPWYIGGPWFEGYRADSLQQGLRAAIATGTADTAGMARLQGHTASRLGEQLAPELIAAIALAREADAEEEGAEGRLAALYAQDPAALDELAARLEAWVAADTPTPTGVETFYHTPAEGELAHATATTLFNAWVGRFQSAVLDDEGFPGVYRPTGGTGRLRTLTRMLDGRGPGNPGQLASWNPDTEESAFFDVLGTEVIETSEELMVSTALDALAWLASPEGFGSAQLDDYLWGYKHLVRFDSILEDFLGSDSSYSALTEAFSITPERLPLMEGLSSSDPRADLDGFPRPGDNFSVDAANSGLNGTDFTYGSGAVFRMVFSLGPDGVEGLNVIPGGQSALTDSPYFDDQARLWLANEAHTLRFAPEDVAEGTLALERFSGAGSAGECR